MAMIICSECGTEVSDQAVSCPKCGVNQNSIEIIKKIKENRQDSCKNNLPNLIYECDELAKPRWYQGMLGKVLFVLSVPLLFVGLGFLIMGILFYLEYRGYMKLKEARYRALPCLKKIYFIIDEGIITSKFEYVLRNEKFTAGAKYREILDYLMYSKAYKLGADAIAIHNQDTSTIVSGSVSTSGFSKSVSGWTSTTVFDNIYVSYVKLKD